MSSPSTLGLFGVIHMDRLGKVTDELDRFVGEADAVFIEYPADPVSVAEYARLVARVPAYALGALLFQLLIYAPLFVLCNRDLYPTEMVAVRRVADKLPVHAVDEHLNEKLRRAGAGLVVANWLVIATVGWLAPVASAATAGVALAGGLLPRRPGVAVRNDGRETTVRARGRRPRGQRSLGPRRAGSEPSAAGQPAGWLSRRWSAGGCGGATPTSRRPARRDRRRLG